MKIPLTSKFTFAPKCAIALPLLALAAPVALGNTGGSDELADLTELSLSDLLNIEVTVASRTEQKLSEVPGAVYVITGDELRRSGHNSVQEAMRMVPGMYVSNWTTSKWDVTSRGFGPGVSPISLAFLNQLMVMIDGVPVNAVTYAGTEWALQDIMLEDVDRIEIIRGPGGILWGANAVHGVVHIITKDAADTQGQLSMIRGQNDERHFAVRTGGSFGETGSYRVYAKRSQYDSNHNDFDGFDDQWRINTISARFDWMGREDYKNLAWGRVYSADLNTDGFDLNLFDYIPVTDNANGFQAFASSASPDGKHTYTAWMNYDRQDLRTEVDSRIFQVDLEYRRAFSFSETSNLSAGAGYRLIKSDLTGDDPFFVDFDPNRHTLNTYRAFAVQTWNLADNDLDIVLGAQMEQNDITGFELQPTARMSWHPGSDYTLWAGFTKSVRTPAIEEISLSSNSYLVGDEDFDSEKVETIEIGFRKQISDETAIDLTVFHNEYDNLREEEFDFTTFQSLLTNNGKGDSTGVELAVDSKPTENWSLRGSYAWIEGSFENEVLDYDLGTESYHPGQQINLRSYYDINDDWEADMGFYYTGDFGNSFFEDRTRLDVRFSYAPREGMEWFFGGQQIVDPFIEELDSFDNPRRDMYFGLTWAPR
ncbi:MAG: iron complex outermembrane receptor protein [Planctomycetota bacterium]|jgi:iron complex outermembrane receptor protein